jgi:LacI family gluconate utilization system Gnt-I transcriptional repressor
LGLPEVTMIDAGQAPVSMKQGAEAVALLGRDIMRFDALVCVSDPVAFGALNACRRLGLDVPSDIAIMGFGNFDVAVVSHSQITTVNVHANQIGRKVAEILQRILEDNTAPQWIDVQSDLVVGETS